VSRRSLPDSFLRRMSCVQMSRPGQRARHHPSRRARVSTFQRIMWWRPDALGDPLAIVQSYPIWGHQLYRLSHQRVTHAQHHSLDPRQSNHHQDLHNEAISVQLLGDG
jgi:hypothetical protein